MLQNMFNVYGWNLNAHRSRASYWSSYICSTQEPPIWTPLDYYLWGHKKDLVYIQRTKGEKMHSIKDFWSLEITFKTNPTLLRLQPPQQSAVMNVHSSSRLHVSLLNNSYFSFTMYIGVGIAVSTATGYVLDGLGSIFGSARFFSSPQR
jgi:hypothetical protein